MLPQAAPAADVIVLQRFELGGVAGDALRKAEHAREAKVRELAQKDAERKASRP